MEQDIMEVAEQVADLAVLANLALDALPDAVDAFHQVTVRTLTIGLRVVAVVITVAAGTIIILGAVDLPIV